NSGIVNSIIAALQIERNQRTVNPGQYVVMQSVHLAEGGAHLASLYDKPFGQRRKSKKAFFQVYSFFAKRNEEIGAGIRVNNRLQAYFRFMHLERRRGFKRVVPGANDEIADHADIRIQRLGGRAASATQTDIFSPASGSRRSRRTLFGSDLGLSRGRGGRSGRRGCRRRWRSWLWLCLELAKLAFQRHYAVFQVAHFLHQRSNITAAGRLLCHCRTTRSE